MHLKQIRFIILHAIVLSNLAGREVTVDEAGKHWSTGLAKTYRELHPFN
jgi:hypothetical protein